MALKEILRWKHNGISLIEDILETIRQGTIHRQSYIVRLIVENLDEVLKINPRTLGTKPRNISTFLRFSDKNKESMNESMVITEFHRVAQQHPGKVSIFTDASRANGRVGCGIYIPGMDAVKKIRAKDTLSIMNVELMSIRES